jgi:hypothetical protein
MKPLSPPVGNGVFSISLASIVAHVTLDAATKSEFGKEQCCLIDTSKWGIQKEEEGVVDVEIPVRYV